MPADASITKTWEKFVSGGELVPAGVRSQVAGSWQRCLQSRVNPDNGCCDHILGSDQLQDLREEHRGLINIARPFMTYLYEFFKGSGYIVVLCDEHGYVLDIFGDKDTLRKAARDLNFIPGASWTELSVGTNAIGTGLVLKRPLRVDGSEHYCRKHHAWTCSAAPIFDPAGRLIGVLDLSGPSTQIHPHTLGMVVAASEAIREQMLTRQKNRELALANQRLVSIIETMSDGVVAFDEHGVITQLNPVAEQIMGKRSRELVGSSVRSIFGNQKWFIDQLLDRHEACHDLEVMVETSKGLVHCRASASPVLDDQGVLSSGLILLRPIERVQKLVNRFSGSQAAFRFEDIIGNSQEIRETVRLASMAAATNCNVLLQGESGTGKELFAQAIHNCSSRRKGPFVAVNCGAIPGELLASELFGYEEGAFTGAKRGGRPGKFELASGGTLFLDEIGDMPREQQVALLRVLQEKKVTRLGGGKAIPVDVRIICATNKDLLEEVEQGNFRDDLYYRVNVITINIPPLRQRAEDIPLLFKYFLERTSRELGVEPKPVDPEVIDCLQRYSWPGNVRQLENVAERMVSIAGDGSIDLACLPEEIRSYSWSPAVHSFSLTDHRQRKRAQAAQKERQKILTLLAKFGGNVSRVAREMGFSRNTLYRKMKRYGIER